MIRTFLTICVGLAFCYATGVWLDKTSGSPVRQHTRIVQIAKSPPAPTQTTPENKLWRITAYCPKSCCCGKWADGITANGHVIKKGDKFVAADLPFGTLLAIEGYADGLAVPVLDRGGAIKGKRIDVFFDSHDEALKWGVQWLEIKL